MSSHDLVARSEQMPEHGGRIEGGSPLAGHHGLPSLLVREAVQNSWDARDDARSHHPVLFSIDGHDLAGEQLDGLRAAMPVHDLVGFERTSEDDTHNGVLHPRVVLARDSVRVLVLSDRRTVGLCGPSRSGQHWSPIRHGAELPRGQQRFSNFVRNIGRATSNIGDGDGGSYGVGKSALWMASECGTVLIHTRTTDADGEPVERFIGAVHGEHFSIPDGPEFTGRHFIGRLADNELIEPFVDERAAEIARSLPIPRYDFDGQTFDGTSIVIVAPRLHLDWETEMNRLRDAVRWQVWPKRVPGVRAESDGPDMEITLSWNGRDVTLPEPLQDPEVRPYARTLLDCARGRESEEPQRDVLAECHRPKTVLGTAKFRSGGERDDNVFHVTLTADELAEMTDDSGLVDDEPAVDFDRPWGQLALIRREPLLLVQYQPIGGPDAAATEVGVFLSAEDPAVEAALTRAEPPAHDEWSHQIVPKDHSRDHRRTLAKRTLEEIKRAKKVFLASFRVAESGEHGSGEQTVSRRISEGLMGGLGGSPRPAPATKSSTPNGRKPRVDLELVATRDDGNVTVHELGVALSGVGRDPVAVRLEASGKGRDNAGALDATDRVRFGWVVAGDATSGPTLTCDAADDWRATMIVEVTGDLRYRPTVSAEVVRAD